MKLYRSLLALAVVLLAARAAQAQTPQIVAPASGLVVNYSAGALSAGGAPITIPAGTLTLLDNQNACGVPQFSACNLIYWAGGTVLLSTTSPATAYAPGNQVLDFITTFGGAVTNVVYAPSIAAPPAGVAVPAQSGLRLPICNAILANAPGQRVCQLSSGSLSGY